MAHPAPPVRIGIPPCLDAAERIRRGRQTHYLDVRYAAAVWEAGAVPLYLPAPGALPNGAQSGAQAAAGAPLAAAGALLDAVDGLLVPGGDDFPSPEPLPPGARLEPASPTQIAFDTALVEAALARGLPVLGICYGMQLLALLHGGSLVHDLPTQRPAARPHQLAEDDGHALEVVADSELARLLGPGPHRVNSLHHQAVADPGRLRAVGFADDGVIEAVEGGDSDPWILGVQWHPEKLPGAGRSALLAGLVAACRARDRRHAPVP